MHPSRVKIVQIPYPHSMLRLVRNGSVFSKLKPELAWWVKLSRSNSRVEKTHAVLHLLLCHHQQVQARIQTRKKKYCRKLKHNMKTISLVVIKIIRNHNGGTSPRTDPSGDILGVNNSYHSTAIVGSGINARRKWAHGSTHAVILRNGISTYCFLVDISGHRHDGLLSSFGTSFRNKGQVFS